ncbi:MAG: hypothetical protein Kow0056_06470 [Coriobacteriia bacterium]
MSGSERQYEPGEPATERVRSIFSGIAPAYDTVNMVASLGIDRLWRRRVVRMSGVGPDSRVLDLAAGTGDLALAMARLGRPALVVATDFVPEMLGIAEDKALRAASECDVVFQQADAQDLPFEDESFDVVTIGFGLRNLPDRAANYSEVLRVLKPGGRYLVLEFSHPPFGPFRAVYGLYLRKFVPVLGWLFSRDAQAYRYLAESIARFPDQGSLAREMEDAGFEVEWRNLTGGIVAVHVGVKPA